MVAYFIMKKIDSKTIFRFLWLFAVLGIMGVLVQIFRPEGITEEPTGIASEVIFLLIGVWIGAFVTQKHYEDKR